MAFLAVKSGRHVYGRMHFLGAAWPSSYDQILPKICGRQIYTRRRTTTEKMARKNLHQHGAASQNLEEKYNNV